MNTHFARARDPMSSYTHYIGALLALGGMVLAVIVYLLGGSGEPIRLFSALLFCLSMLALYSASAYYHYFNGPLRSLSACASSTTP